jgi:hypothetical protein
MITAEEIVGCLAGCDYLSHLFYLPPVFLEVLRFVSKGEGQSIDQADPVSRPNGGFLYFRPVEFLEQSSYSSLELRLDVEPSRTGTTVMVHPKECR